MTPTAPLREDLMLESLGLHCLRWNAGGAAPMVLLHGLASNARIWELTAPHLAAAGYHVLAPDQRGHGLSRKPGSGYDFERCSGDVRALLETMGLRRPVLVGHSWGALVALEFAARFAASPLGPRALALVDGGLFSLRDLPGLTWEQARAMLTPPDLAGMPRAEFLQRLSRNPRWQPDARERDIILANFEVDERDCITPRLKRAHHMEIVRAMWEYPLWERLRRVACPVLGVAAFPGEPRTPREARFAALKERGLLRAQRENPRLRIRRFENTVHDIPLQRPWALAQVLLEFLGE